MAASREPTPWDNPFPGGISKLRKELSNSLETFIYTFEHDHQDKSSMSRQLHLNEEQLLLRSKEIGGQVCDQTQSFMQACADYANGHGKIERVYECLESLRDGLR